MSGDAVRVRRPARLTVMRLLLMNRLLFGWYFRSLRVANLNRLPEGIEGPLIIYLNHASWWDPLPVLLLQLTLFPQRVLFAPSDATALADAEKLSKIGFFPVDTGTLSGTKQFLRDCSYVLGLPDGVLSITPEGEFRDPRIRPLQLRRGLASLVARTGRVTVLPLAIEYTIWDKNRPEILASWGSPLFIENGRSKPVDEWHTILTDTLTATMDELAHLSMIRDLPRFQTLVFGRVGRRNLGELWRSLKSVYYQGR